HVRSSNEWHLAAAERAAAHLEQQDVRVRSGSRLIWRARPGLPKEPADLTTHAALGLFFGLLAQTAAEGARADRALSAAHDAIAHVFRAIREEEATGSGPEQRGERARAAHLLARGGKT